MDTLVTRVQSGIPCCVGCGGMLLNLDRVSRRVVVSSAGIDVIWSHRIGLCEARQSYLSSVEHRIDREDA
jgi:hypothetical protein